MATYLVPQINDNADGWGPPEGLVIDKLAGFPLETITKKSIIGKVCDFSASAVRQREIRSGRQEEGAEQFDEDESFHLVDTRPTVSRNRGFGRRGFGRFGRGRGRGLAMLKTDDRFGSSAAGGRFGAMNMNQMQKGGKGMKGGKGGKKGKGKGRGRFHQRNNFKSFKDWSVMTQPDWEVVSEITLISLAKLQIDANKVSFDDVLWCGKLQPYEKTYDKINPRMEKKLTRFESIDFYSVSTSDDPVLADLIQKEEYDVAATDQILACLMATGRSIYSWDIVITKVGNKIVFDKRDGSAIDFISVNETSMDPPIVEDKESINAPQRLGQEASCINQNFTQMVLDPHNVKQMEYPNPFEEEGDDAVPAASGAYRYRRIVLPGDKNSDGIEGQAINMIVRAEVNCTMPGSETEYCALHALHEYDPKSKGWRQTLESQRGGVLATELKNNAARLARWTAQAMIADVKHLKLGYVSRVNVKDPWVHSLLGVQTYKTEEFSQQIGLQRNNVWGIVRSIVNVVLGMPDGKYILLKDPSKSIVRMYSVPWNSFDEDEEEEE